MANKSTKKNNTLLATFGILTDVQYADIPDVIFNPDKTRYYRNSLNLVGSAVDYWTALEQKTGQKLAFVLQLGDIIEGYRNPDPKMYEPNVLQVCNELERINNKKKKITPIYHVWGNHELYAFPVDYLSGSILHTALWLNQEKPQGRNYYSFDVTDALTFICLDQYEISVLGLNKMDDRYILAKKMIDLATYDTDNLFGLKFKPWNGGVTNQQLNWLGDTLDNCKANNKRVVLCGHVPLIAEAADTAIVWNSKRILNLVWSYGDLVAAYLCGHYHRGGFHIDTNGMRHLTIPAILEQPPIGPNSFVTGLVYQDRFELRNKADPSLNFTIYF